MMDKSETIEKLKKRNYEIDALQFEHLCKIVVEEVENPDGIETTRKTKDEGIDVRGFVGNELYTGEFGIQVKQFQSDSKVSSGTVRGLDGSLRGQGCRFGTLITTSSYTSDAIEKVNDTDVYSITLINGDELAELMLEHELGVQEQPSEDGREFTIDPEFWSRFDKFSGDLIPSWRVPQADSFEVLNLALKAVDDGNHHKSDIVQYLTKEREESWTPRQADYYTTAGHILGYLDETEPKEDDITTRRWELTESGWEYIEHLRTGAEDQAADHLSKHIKEIEIIRVIFEKIKDEYKIPRSTVEEIIREETEITGTTVGRRTSTVGKWLSKHPDVKRMEKNMIWFEYYQKDLGDWAR